jgi:hypothetical protein
MNPSKRGYSGKFWVQPDTFKGVEANEEISPYGSLIGLDDKRRAGRKHRRLDGKV